jgi:hypothetical protein
VTVGSFMGRATATAVSVATSTKRGNRPLPWILMDLTHQVFGTWLWPFFLLGQLATATLAAGSPERPPPCLGFKTPFQAILKELGKDVQIRFAYPCCT